MDQQAAFYGASLVIQSATFIVACYIAAKLNDSKTPTKNPKLVSRPVEVNGKVTRSYPGTNTLQSTTSKTKENIVQYSNKEAKSPKRNSRGQFAKVGS